MVAGRYTVLQELGSGSTSTTYKARTPDGTVVALKAMSFRAMTDWKQLELFEREASILRSLSHPCIPAHIDSFEVDTDDDRAYVLVQELAQGETLEQLVGRGWRVDEAEVQRIATELLGVLEYLGGRRPPVVHRCAVCGRLLCDVLCIALTPGCDFFLFVSFLSSFFRVLGVPPHPIIDINALVVAVNVADAQ